MSSIAAASLGVTSGRACENRARAPGSGPRTSGNVGGLDLAYPPFMAFEEARAQMVEGHLVGRGISDPRVLEAFRSVPREAFVPPELAESAYRDMPLPIGENQTISQPYIVALTTEALRLRGNERVLDIGTGSGYAAAVLGRVAREVFTVERRETLVAEARERLERLGYHNVHVLHGDGTLGWPE